MADFRGYSPEEVIAENLAETAERLSRVGEQERAHVWELAREILMDAADPAALLDTLPDRRPPRTPPSDRWLPENRAAIEALLSRLDHWRAEQLCTALRAGLGLSRHDLPELSSESTRELDEAARGRVIYQRNAVADRAFRLFSSSLPSAHALYTHSPSVAAEEVARGACEFCILPLEHAGTTLRLLSENGLRIAAVAELPTADGSRHTRQALVRRTLLPPLLPIDGACSLECLCPTDALSPAALLGAAEAFGLSLLGVSTQTLADAQPALHLCLSIGDGDLAAFLCYLAMEAPLCELLGIYPILGADAPER